MFRASWGTTTLNSSEHERISVRMLYSLEALHVRERLSVRLAVRCEYELARDAGVSVAAVCADDDVRGQHLPRLERDRGSLRVRRHGRGGSDDEFDAQLFPELGQYPPELRVLVVPEEVSFAK